MRKRYKWEIISLLSVTRTVLLKIVHGLLNFTKRIFSQLRVFLDDIRGKICPTTAIAREADLKAQEDFMKSSSQILKKIFAEYARDPNIHYLAVRKPA